MSDDLARQLLLRLVQRITSSFRASMFSFSLRPRIVFEYICGILYLGIFVAHTGDNRACSPEFAGVLVVLLSLPHCPSRIVRFCFELLILLHRLLHVPHLSLLPFTFSFLLLEECIIVSLGGYGVGMIGTQLPFVDRQGTLVEQLSLLVLALSTVEQCQVVEASRCVGVIWS